MRNRVKISDSLLKPEFTERRNYSFHPGLFLAYKLLMDFSYLLVHHLFGTEDGIWYPLDLSPIKLIMSYLFVASIIYFLPKSFSKFSSFILYFQVFLMVIPMLTLYSMLNENTLFILLIVLGFILQCLIVNKLCNFKVLFVKNANLLIVFGLLAMLFVTFVGLFISMGMPSLVALNFSKVYEVRSDVNMSKYLGYIFSLVTKVILPFFMCITLYKKMYIRFFLAVSCQFIFFLWTGHKSFLLSIPVVLAFSLCLSHFSKFEKHFFILLFSGFFIFFILALIPNESTRIPFDLFTRRVLFVPANLKFKYFDFFNFNPKLGLTGLFPTWLVPLQNPYTIPYPYVIGNLYFNSPNMSANTGYFVEGFARFGFLGFFTSFIAMALLLRFIDVFLDKKPKQLFYPLFTLLLFSLNDGFLFSSFSIVGIFPFALLLLMFWSLDYLK